MFLPLIAQSCCRSPRPLWCSCSSALLPPSLETSHVTRPGSDGRWGRTKTQGTDDRLTKWQMVQIHDLSVTFCITSLSRFGCPHSLLSQLFAVAVLLANFSFPFRATKVHLKIAISEQRSFQIVKCRWMGQLMSITYPDQQEEEEAGRKGRQKDLASIQNFKKICQSVMHCQSVLSELYRLMYNLYTYFLCFMNCVLAARSATSCSEWFQFFRVLGKYLVSWGLGWFVRK